MRAKEQGEESVGGLEHIACFCRELLRVEELDQSRSASQRCIHFGMQIDRSRRRQC